MSERDAGLEQALGCGLGLALHVVFQVLFIIALEAFHPDPYAPLLVPFAFFASQLAYMLPAAYVARCLGRPRLARYLLIQAGVLFLLGGVCDGLLLLNSALT